MPFKRGEIYRLRDDEVGKPRPVVIVSRDEFNTGSDLLVVPFFSQQVTKRQDDLSCSEFGPTEGGLTVGCMAMCGYMQSIKKTELRQPKLGSFNASQMERLMDAVKWTLDLE